jgi:ribose 5-phosphate isomerase A
MRLSDLSQHPELDVAIDGADEVDPALNCIKGGGACHTQEKLVAVAAAHFVVIADSRKRSARLLTGWRKGIPLEVLPLAYVPVMKRIEALGGQPRLRMAVAKAGPVVTDNGNFVIDADFGGGAGIDDPKGLHIQLKLIAGVVETGIFAGIAEAAYFGNDDGGVEVVTLAPGTGSSATA